MKSSNFKLVGLLCLISLLMCNMTLSSINAVGKRDASNSDIKRESPSKGSMPRFAPGEIVVKFKEGSDPHAVLDTLGLDPQNMQRIHSITPVIEKYKKDYLLNKKTSGWFPFLGKNYKSIDEIPDADIFKEAYTKMPAIEKSLYRNYKINLPVNKDVEEIVSLLKKNPNVEFAEPNFIAKSNFTPNDPLYAQQWAHQNTHAEGGWDITKGNSNVVIAIVDGGVDYTHEDLATNIWKDAQNRPGIDLVDINTQDYINSGFTLMSGEDYTQVDYDPSDFYGHGTHCAGIAAAVSNNQKGVAGVAQQCKIMPVRAGFTMIYQGNVYGLLQDDTIAQGIRYAADNGARVISMSFGFSSNSQLLKDAIDYAYSHNVVLVAAAGNESSSTVSYPAGYSNVISVSATAQDDAAAYYSNYGNWIDVAAPGGDAQKNCLIMSTVPPTSYLGTASGYRGLQGTSMACPYVAGAAALILSNHPEFTNANVTTILENTADDLGAQGFDPIYGYGRINILNALSANITCTSTITSPLTDSFLKGAVEIRGSAFGLNFNQYTLDYRHGQSDSWHTITTQTSPVNNGVLGTWNTNQLNSGTYTLRLTVKDNSGNEYYANINVSVDQWLKTGWPVEFDNWVSEPVIADVNNDGKLEVIVSHYGGTKIYILNQDGTPLSGWPQTVGFNVDVGNPPLVCDLDNDGKLEIAFVDPIAKKVIAMHPDGTLVTGWPVNFQGTFTGNIPLFAEDVNNDGSLEVICLLDNFMYIWNSQGQLLPGSPIAVSRDYNNLRAFATGDIDGDGIKEIVIGANNNLYVYKANGTILPGWPKQLEKKVHFIALGDADKDGKLEIFATAWEDNKLYAFKANGSNLANWPVSVDSGTALWSIALGDVNNDGNLEIFSGYDPYLCPGPNKIFAWDYTGAALSHWPLTLPLNNADSLVGLSGISIADISGNGNKAIVIHPNNNQIYAYDVNGTLMAGFPLETIYHYGHRSTLSPAIGDIDNDGKIELVSAFHGYFVLPSISRLYAWDLPGTKNVNGFDWPMYKHDTQLTSCLVNIAQSTAPTNLTATATSSTQINLAWTDNATNEQGFKIERSTSATTGFSEIGTVAANVTTYQNTGLTAGSTYYYRVRAYNASGNSGYSNVANATTTQDIAAPTNLTATATSSTQINLAWTDNATNEQGFKIERSTSATTGFSEIGTVAANVTTYQNTGLTAGSTYYYRVRAYNASGNSGYSNVANATTTQDIAAPTNLTATATSSTQINLAWTDNATNEQGFKIERSTSATTGFSEIGAVAANVTTYQNTGLTAGSTYYYRVRAYNATLNSNYSNVTNATTQGIGKATLISPSGTITTHLPTYTWSDISNSTWYNLEVNDTSGNTVISQWITAEDANCNPTTGVCSATPSVEVVGQNTWKIQTYSATGEYGPWSDPMTFTAPSNLPGKATLVSPSGSITTTTPTYKWNAVSGSTWYLFSVDNASGNQIYTWYLKEDAGCAAGTGVCQVTPSTALTEGPYSFKVQTYNDFGYGPWSDAMNFQIAGQSIPTAPTNLTATATSSTQINLAWTDNATNEQGFKIERSTSATTGFSEIGTVAANVTTYQNTGLTAGSTYYYRVRAYNASGNSGYSNVANATTTQDIAAPTNLTATATSSTQINLAWTDNATNEQGFKIERSTSATTGFSEIGTVAANVTTYQNTGLTAGSTYYYRVRAYNASGNSGYSNVANATTTQDIAAPTNLTATATSSTQINLAWTDNATNEQGFKIERSTSATTGFSEIGAVAANVTTYQNTGLTAGSTYYYRVRAYNASGNSGYSNVANATTTQDIAAPTNLTATATSSTQINLAWTDNATNEQGFKIERSTSATTGFSEIGAVAANVTTYQNTGLTAGSTYYYRVRAYNATLNSNYSNVTNATTQGIGKATLISPSGTITTHLPTYTWSDISNSTWYNLEVNDTSGNTVISQWITAEDANCNPTTGVCSATPSVEVVGQNTWKIQTYSATGEYGPWSDPMTFTAPSNLPGKATLVSPSGSITTTTPTYKWNAVSGSTWYLFSVDNASGNQIYTWYLKEDAGCAAGTGVCQVTPSTALTEGPYSFKVQTYNDFGYGPWSDAMNFQIAGQSIPTAPTNLTATATSSTQINLAWTDNATNEQGFKIERSTSATTGFSEIGTVAANVTTYQNTGLTAGSTYYYRVRAYNASGNSGYSNVANATTPSVPGAPTALGATAYSSTQINLAWTDNATNEQGFNIEHSTNGTTFTALASVTANVTTYQHTGLTGGTRHYYRVRAYNAAGNSAYSNIADATTTTVPNAPTNLVATAASSTEIGLTWTDNATDEQGYRVERSLDGTTFTQIAQLSADVTAYSNTGLAAGTKYYYRVRAYNASGNSGYSNVANATTPSVPGAPTALGATAYSSTQINLAWTDNATNEQGFNIEHSTNGTTFTALASVTANVTTYQHTGLTGGTRHYYRVRAYNAAGNSAYSNIADATTTTVPNAPTNLVATAASSTEIGLTWTDNATDEQGYRVERSLDGTTFTQIAQLSADVTAYSNTGLAAGTKYYYRVRAYNASGNSGYSNVANATTPSVPGAPTALGATAYSSTQINLAWTDNATNEQGFNIEHSTNGTTFTALASVTANVTTYQHTGLTGGTRHYYRVRAYNAAGNSAYSNIADATTTTVPNAPTNLVATAASSTEIGLTWTDNATDEQGYRVERSLDGTTFTQIAQLSADVTAYSNTGLAAGTKYYYRVRAYNASGNSGYSNVANATTPSVPGAPTALGATAYSSTQINLAWTDNATNEQGFNIEHSTNGTTFTALASVTANVTTYQHTGLTGGTRHYYRVRAYNAAGNSAYSNIADATTTTVPNAPTNLVATAASSTEIGLTWTDNATDEQGYRVERSLDGTTFTQIAQLSADVTAYSNTGLAAGTKYYYRVRAYNASGNSGYSNVANATTPSVPGAPTALGATAYSSTQINLAWTDNATNEQGFNIEHSTNGTTFTALASVTANVTTYQHTGLTGGTRHYYRVRAYNAAGNSAYSNIADATTTTVPNAPTNLVATAASSTEIGLTWTDNATDEQGYRVERSLDGTTFTQIAQLSADVTAYSNTGLAAGTKYYYRVRAYNASGNSGYSNVANATTPSVPGAPTALGATAYSSTQINLAWTDNATNEQGFNIEHSTNGTTFTALASVTANVTTYQHTGLTGGTRHYYRVRAYNAAGNSAYSNIADATTTTVPNAPTNLVATAASSTEIGLTWTDNATDEQGYRVERSLDGTTFTQIAQLSADVTAYSNTGLAAGTKYYYRVRAYNASGNSGYSNVANATTPSVPGAPTALGATAYSSTQINLAWTDNATNEQGFNIEHSTNGTTFTALASVTANVTTYQHTGLTGGTRHYYRVRAYNAAGNSAYSNIADATTTTVPNAPTNLVATAASSTEIGLTWTDNATDEQGYRVERSLDGTTFTQIAQLSADVTAYSNTGLAAGTKYYYRVRAYNASGNSGYSNVANATTPSVPGAPTALGATAYSSTQINLAWTDNATNEQGFNIEHSTNGTTFTALASVTANVTTYQHTGLTGGTRHYYRVRAYNAAGNSAYSNIADATTTTVPNAPTNLVATAASSTEIGLTWTDNATDEQGYRVERSLDGTTFTQIAQLSADVTAYSNTGLAAGTKYYYRVRAYNASGNSGYSNVANATTPSVPGAPTALGATAYSSTQINLAWTDNATNEQGFNIEHSTNGTTFTALASVTANVTTYQHTGLTGGTRHYYRVRAYNAAGNSAYSNIADATTTTVPNAPTNLVATAASSTEIGLTWTDNATDEQGYRVERSLDGTTFTQIAQLSADVTAYSNTGLAAGTKYYYRVRAYNASGNSGYSNVANATTPSVPGAPTALGATAYSSTQINLAWTDNATNEQGFNIEHSTNGTTFTALASVTANVTTYQHTGLTGGTRHYYRVRAYNAAGNSAYSNIADATTTTVPNAPTNLVATAASSTEIGLTWTDNATDEQGYRVERSLDGTTFTQIAQLSADVTAYSNTGLAAGTKYYYRVRAYNASGNSGYSNVANATTPSVPGAPTALGATAYSSTQINLAWTDNATNEQGFNIEHSTNGTTFTALASVTANVTTYQHTGLTGGTRHYYRVRAYNAAGNSAYSNIADATTTTVPNAPTNLVATAASSTEIGLTWTDNATDEQGYRVERSLDGTTFTQIAQLSADVTAYSNTGLAAGTKYYYRVRAYNASGNSGYSNVANATTPSVPGAPTALGATAYSSTQINLAWTDNATNEQGFNIEHSTNGTTFTALASVTANVTTYQHTGLTGGTRHYYRVRAYNAAGNSAYSNIADATTTTVPNAPTNLVATAASSTEIGLTWTDNATDEQGYRVERSLDGTTFTQIAQLSADVTAYSNTGLAAGTKYYYRVRAYNASGNSGYSNVANATTPSVPGAPTALGATAYSSTQINLAWTDNATNEQGFNIEHSTNGTTFTALASVTANVTTYQHTGLTGGTRHYYRVRAYNAAGNSAYSNIADATTPGQGVIPDAPSDLTLTEVSSTEVVLSWADNSTNEDGFKIERSTNGTTFTEIGTVTSDVTAYDDTGLTAGSTYYYRVRAYNAAGNSGYSNVANTTPVPSAPSSLSATAISSTQINLAWTDNANNEQGFKIERSTSATTGFSEIGTVLANVTSFQNTGLIAGATYYYRVKAYNASGDSEFSNIANATTPIAPIAPSSLTATSASSTQVNLAWTDNADNEQGFKIERSTSATTGFSEIGTVLANVTTYQNTGLTTGTTYYYRVRAYNVAGNSGYSNVANATAGSVPNAPSGLTSTAASSTQVNLAWTDNADNEQGFKIERSTSATTGFSEIGTVLANVTTYQNTGLTAGSTYYYRVRAYNASGNSSYSNVANITLPLTAPIAPTSLTATSASSTQINLAWTDNADNEQGFKIERSTSATTGFSEIGTVLANVTTYQNTGLTTGTTYYYRVRAYNVAGNSGYSNVANATASNSAPETGSISPINGSSQVSEAVDFVTTYSDADGYQDIKETRLLIFTQPMENAGLRYVASQNKLYLGNDTATGWIGGFTPGSANIIQNSYVSLDCSKTAVSHSGTTLTIVWNVAPSALIQGQMNVYMRVIDLANADSGWVLKGTWTIGNGLPPPMNLTAAQTADDTISIGWAYLYPDYTGFKIERKIDSGSFIEVATTEKDVNYYDDAPLTKGHTYTYRVRAYDATTNSDYSPEASFTLE